MSPTAEILRELLAATPAPPEDQDADALLVAFAAIAVRRDTVMARVVGSLRLVDDEDRAAWDGIEARHAAWLDALAAARQRIAGIVTGVRRLTAYHVRSDDGALVEVG